jgi:hypothetical protein
LETLRAAGFTVEAVRQLAAPTLARPATLGEVEVADLFDLLAGAVGLTEKTSTFLRRDVVRAVGGWVRERADADTIELLTDRFLADSRVVLVQARAPGQRRRHQPELIFTTEDLLAAEDSLSALIRDGLASRSRCASTSPTTSRCGRWSTRRSRSKAPCTAWSTSGLTCRGRAVGSAGARPSAVRVGGGVDAGPGRGPLSGRAPVGASSPVGRHPVGCLSSHFGSRWRDGYRVAAVALWTVAALCAAERGMS